MRRMIIFCIELEIGGGLTALSFVSLRPDLAMRSFIATKFGGTWVGAPGRSEEDEGFDMSMERYPITTKG